MRALKSVLHKWFIAHPESIGETYWQHWWMALGFSMQLFRAAAACLIHAMVPVCFVTNASQAVESLYGQIFAERRSKQVSSSTAAAEPASLSCKTVQSAAERSEGQRD